MIRTNLFDQLNRRPAGMPRWAAWLTMAASFAVGITLFLVAASLALILIPVVAIAGAIAIWRLKARLKAAGFERRADPFAGQARPQERIEIIDAEYRIIESSEPPRR